MSPSRPLQKALHKALRLAGLHSRALQIPEIVEAAEEHLKIVSLPGISQRYLPCRLAIAVSAADLESLTPFEDDLRRALQNMARKLGQKRTFHALAKVLDIDLSVDQELGEGDAPRFQATFPEGPRQATWQLVPRAKAGKKFRSTTIEKARPVLLEVVLTIADTERTAMQSLFTLCLEPTLPVAAIEADDAGSIVLRSDGGLEILETGENWNGVTPQVGHAPNIPDELEGGFDLPPEIRGSTLYRFFKPGQPEVLWAPQGLILVGRSTDDAHWVPAASPRNLSGRHLALLRAPRNGIRLVDLGSTNGTYVGGRRLRAYERVQVELPETIAVGTEGTMTMDLRLAKHLGEKS